MNLYLIVDDSTNEVLKIFTRDYSASEYLRKINSQEGAYTYLKIVEVKDLG